MPGPREPEPPGPGQPAPGEAGAPGEDEWFVRYRAWIVMGVLILALLIVGLVGVGGENRPSSPTQPRTVFGSRVVPPVHADVLDMVNGWEASDGRELVGVFAGSDASDPQRGLLAVERTAGRRIQLYPLFLRGSGPITLLRPANVDTMSAAEQSVLHFVTAEGSTGTINLVNDRITLMG